MLGAETGKLIKRFFSEIIDKKKYTVLACEFSEDHAHMLCCANDRTELVSMVRTLKAVSAKKMLEQAGGNSEAKHFWARKYGCKKVPESQLTEVVEYIKKHGKG